MKRYILLMISIIMIVCCPVVSAKSLTEIKIENSVKRADIVIAGSSSISKWENAEMHFSPYSVANLGICGSKVEDWQKYYKYISKCKPKAIVVYIGGNNIIKNKSGLGIKTASKIKKLLKSISVKNSKAKIYYVSIHPSPKRWNAWKQAQICNNTVKKWCKKQKQIEFIDITKHCLRNGKPNKKLLMSDKLHFNNKGYNHIWKNVVAKKVKRQFKF